MNRNYMTADKLYQLTMAKVAPLPCQERYVRNLAELFSYHLKKNLLIDEGFSPESLPTQNAIILAPSGQGKSFLLKQMAKISNIHVISIDGSTLCREGWKGISLSQKLLAEKKALQDSQKFQQSILFIDEVDKLRYWGTQNDQGGAQENLLQLFGGTSIMAEDSHQRTEMIDCKRMTILMAGAFSGLEDIVRNRLNQKTSIGFCPQGSQPTLSTAELIKLASQQDLVQYGMLNELMGRIGSILTIDPLGKQDYRQLLTAGCNSICGQYQTYFLALYGIGFEITDKGADLIAERCIDSPAGARALSPLVNNLLRSAMTQADLDANINKIILDAEDGSPCIRCDVGKRKKPSVLDENRFTAANRIWLHQAICYRLKAGSSSALTSKLCLLYLEAEGSLSDTGLICVFLNCCIYYMKHHCNPEDFILDSLFKLAKTTRKSQIEEISTFDIMMQDGIHADGDRHILLEHYRLFCAIFTVHSTNQLIDALNRIQDKLMAQSQNRTIAFKISDVD